MTETEKRIAEVAREVIRLEAEIKECERRDAELRQQRVVWKRELETLCRPD